MRKWIAVAQALAGLVILLVGDLPAGTEAAAYAVILALGGALWPSSSEPEPDHEDPGWASVPGEPTFDAARTEREPSTVGGDSSVGRQPATESEQER